MTIKWKGISYVNLERHLSLQVRPTGGLYQALCDLGIRANSLKEEGNLKYDYFLAAEAPEDLLLVESWTTPELQQAHCQTEIFGRLQELKAQYCDSVQIDKFDH